MYKKPGSHDLYVGVVKSYNASKGFGFIEAEGEVGFKEKDEKVGIYPYKKEKGDAHVHEGMMGDVYVQHEKKGQFYFHKSSIQKPSGFQALKAGQKVYFKLTEQKGLQASDVLPVDLEY